MYIYTNFNLDQSVPRFSKIIGGIKPVALNFFYISDFYGILSVEN